MKCWPLSSSCWAPSAVHQPLRQVGSFACGKVRGRVGLDLICLLWGHFVPWELEKRRALNGPSLSDFPQRPQVWPGVLIPPPPGIKYLGGDRGAGGGSDTGLKAILVAWSTVPLRAISALGNHGSPGSSHTLSSLATTMDLETRTAQSL